MKTTHNRSRRALAVERLESRTLLAGNVVVDKDGSSLDIRGDNADNAILVRRTGSNQYQVQGINDADGNPTSVNGVPNGSVTFGGIKRDLDIRMRSGDDLLGIGNDDADLTALLDELTGGAAFIPGPADRVRIKNNLVIDMGGGDDAAGLFVKVDDDAVVKMDSGTDFLAIEGSRIGDNLVVTGEAGNDFLRVRNTNVDELFNITSNGGEDSLQVLNVNAEDANIDLGGQNDAAEIDDLDVKDNLFVFLRDGDDVLSIDNSKAKRAIFRGAGGNDSFNDDLGNDFDSRSRKGFEIIT